MAPLRIGLLGASGETGQSILNGLLDAGQFHIIALTRPSSMSKPANLALKDRGVELRSLDTKGPHDSLVAALKDVEVLISAIGPKDQLEQIPLATAARAAGVRRFFPCAAVTVMAPGMHIIRDVKEQVYNHIKHLGLSYTIVDVGWWYQLAFPAVPSGKVNYSLGAPTLLVQHIAGDGNVPSALTDVRDVGRYFARLVVDERTVNRYVLVYNELWTQNQIYDAMERLSGEKLVRSYVSREELEKNIADAKAKIANDPEAEKDFNVWLALAGSQYRLSWGVRGDNTPEYAKYLGYLTSKELYPDMSFVKFEDLLKEVLDGDARVTYAEIPSFLDGMKID